jgi:hypothetical protein
MDRVAAVDAPDATARTAEKPFQLSSAKAIDWRNPRAV